jgi:hypothetical protein
MASETNNSGGLNLGGLPLLTRDVVLDTGNLAVGAVLGRITTGGKYILSASAASDGSQVPAAILMEAADATAADVTVKAAFMGEFDSALCSFGAGHTVASVDASFASTGRPIKLTVLT